MWRRSRHLASEDDAQPRCSQRLRSGWLLNGHRLRICRPTIDGRALEAGRTIHLSALVSCAPHVTRPAALAIISSRPLLLQARQRSASHLVPLPAPPTSSPSTSSLPFDASGSLLQSIVNSLRSSAFISSASAPSKSNSLHPLPGRTRLLHTQCKSGSSPRHPSTHPLTFSLPGAPAASRSAPSRPSSMPSSSVARASCSASTPTSSPSSPTAT